MRLHFVTPVLLLIFHLATAMPAVGQGSSGPTPPPGPPAAATVPIPTSTAPPVSTCGANPTDSHEQLHFTEDPVMKHVAENLVNAMTGAANSNSSMDVSAQARTFNVAVLAAATSCAGTSEADATASLKAEAATNNSNKQNGAPATSSGSTSVTEKPGIPTLLGIAVENGAISNNINGTTMTLSSTIYGVASVFGKDSQTFYNRCFVCVRTGSSATFNIANTSDPLASATHRQISQWQIKYTFQDKSERSKSATRLYDKTLLHAAAQQLANTLSDPRLRTLSKMDSWVNQSVRDSASALAKAVTEIKSDLQSSGANSTTLTDPQASAIAANLLTNLEQDKSYQNLLQQQAKDPAVVAAVASYAVAMAEYVKRDDVFETEIKNLQKGWNEALVFSQQYPSTTTSTGTVTSTPPTYLVSEFDISYQPGARTASQVGKPDLRPSLTANFNGTVYPDPLAALNEQTFRGGMAALSSAWNLGSGPFIQNSVDKSQLTLTLSGKYTRLQENEHRPGKKADIALGNLKLEIPFGSGLSLPLSITVANADQQIKESYVRGSFGISFDLDKLTALLKAKN